MPIEGNGIMGPPAPMYTRPPIDDRLRSQLHDLESDQNAAPFDEIRIYEDEKDTVSVVTLESLGSIPGHRATTCHMGAALHVVSSKLRRRCSSKCQNSAPLMSQPQIVSIPS
ncbi:hypothetical protein OSTOST_18632 [Ostertagia ostertagi]